MAYDSTPGLAIQQFMESQNKAVMKICKERELHDAILQALVKQAGKEAKNDKDNDEVEDRKVNEEDPQNDKISSMSLSVGKTVYGERENFVIANLFPNYGAMNMLSFEEVKKNPIVKVSCVVGAIIVDKEDVMTMKQEQPIDGKLKNTSSSTAPILKGGSPTVLVKPPCLKI